MGKIKTIKRVFIYTLFSLLAIIGIVFIIYVGPSIWKYWVTYPRLDNERAELWEKRKTPKQ